MAIFSHRGSQNRASEQNHHSVSTRKLYVLASQPLKGDIESTDWSIQVEISRPIAPPTMSHRKQNSLFSHKSRPRSSSTSDLNMHDNTQHLSKKPESISTSDLTITNTFFTFTNGAIAQSAQSPPHVVMRILIPLASTHDSLTNEDFLRSITQSLHHEHSSNSTSLTLCRSSLSNLESAHILTDKRAIDVDKFVYFAVRNLEQEDTVYGTLRNGVREIDYSTFVRENMQLRRLMEEGTRGIIHGQSEDEDEGNHVEMQSVEANVNGRMNVKTKRIWGGFRITYGSYSSGQDTRDVYGGLM